MNVELEDFKTGWFKINIGVRSSEVDGIIEMLKSIKRGENEHFHFMGDYEGEKGVGDVDFYIKADEQPDNMQLSGPPIRPK